jgi:outer membrane protein OmpA-like peptidoglycan-associated protein
MVRRLLALPVAVGIVTLLAAAGPLAAQQTRAERAAASEIARVAESLDEARSRQLYLISPRHFEKAEELIDRARRDLDEGDLDEGDLEDIADRLADAEAELAEAEALETTGRALLRVALDARELALEAGARDYSATEWNAAEREAREAGRRVESNEINDARERAVRAADAYRVAEAGAAGSDVLGSARLLAEEAEAADARRYAPVSLQLADSLLTSAEQILAAEPANRTEAQLVAEEAGQLYGRSIRISLLADSVRRNHLTSEQLILRYESLLAELAGEMGLEPDFSTGAEPVVEQLDASIRSLLEDRDRLEASVIGWTAEADRLEGVVDSLDARLAEIEEREASASSELRAARRREQRVVEARAIFSPGEAEVLVTDDQLLMRLVGLTFSSGSAEVTPGNYSLLTKVQAVVREFPYANVVVEGHTDSTGNDDSNRRLSQARADAVRDYLLQNSTISAEKITAEGFGETRPIASNNSAQDRERNRRIDIRVSPID